MKFHPPRRIHVNDLKVGDYFSSIGRKIPSLQLIRSLRENSEDIYTIGNSIEYPSKKPYHFAWYKEKNKISYFNLYKKIEEPDEMALDFL